MPRLAPVLAVLFATAVAPASASAADLYAAPSAGSLRAAMLSARATPEPDTVHLAPGIYRDRLSAVSEADTGVTLAGAGAGATVLAPLGGDDPVLELGAGAGAMAITGLTIDTSGAGALTTAIRARLAQLALGDVTINHTGATPKLAPAIDADTAGGQLVLNRVTIASNAATGINSTGVVNAGGPLTILDSTIATTAVDVTPTVLARDSVVVQRSTLRHGDSTTSGAYVLRVVNSATAVSVIVDSSILAGARSSARLEGGVPASLLALRGATLAPLSTGGGNAVELVGAGVVGGIDSSLLVGRGISLSGGAKATCRYTNLPSSPSATCPISGTNNVGAKNTSLATAALLLDANLVPQPGSPAIDSGNPGGVAAGESPTDIGGRPRAASSADVCDAGAGIRDKGAVERYRPSPSAAILGPPAPALGVAAAYSATTSAGAPQFTWSFGDGTTGGNAPSTSHVFTRTGASSVAVTVTDLISRCARAATLPLNVIRGAGAGTDLTKPKLTKVKLGGYDRRAKRATLRFRLSEAATLTVTVGRVSGKRVVAKRRFKVTRRKGAGTVALTAKRLKFRRGAYAVTVSARDTAGNTSKTLKLALTVR